MPVYKNYLLYFMFFLLCKSQVAFSQDYQAIAKLSRKDWYIEIYKHFYVNNEFRKDSLRFFNDINKLRIAAQKEQNEELELEVAFLRFNYLSSRNFSGYIQEIETFKEKVDQTRFNQLKARTRQALGFHYFHETKQYEKAIKNFVESFDFIEQIPVQELPDKQELVYNIAFIYYHVGYFESTLEYLTIAEGLTNTYYKELPLNIKATKGMILYERGELKKAARLFTELKLVAKQLDVKVWMAISDVQQAKIYFSEQKYQEAKNLLEKSIQYDYDQWDNNLKISYHVQLAQIYDKLKLQKNVIEQAQVLEHLEGKKKPEEYLQNTEQIVRFKAIAKKHQGDFNAAIALMDSAYVLAQNISKQKNAALIKQADSKENIMRYLKQKSELKYQRKLLITIITGAALLVSLLLYIAYIRLQKEKIKGREKQLQLEIEKQEIDTELKNVSVRLEELTNSLLFKNHEIQKYQEELAQIENKQSSDPEDIQRKEYLRMLLSKALLTDEKWNEFKRAFENVHVGYIKNVKNILPHISESELRYLVLKKMDLSAKEIAGLLGIKPDSIRMYRMRIRKKHDLDDDARLESLLLSI